MVLIMNIVFRDVITCIVVSSYQCSGEKNCLHLHDISFLYGGSRDLQNLDNQLSDCMAS